LKDKGKYEMAAGLLKSGEELVDVYIDLLNKYPRIVMFIEPFTHNVS
jgi:enolase